MTLNRRRLLRRGAAAMTVAAFVPETKSWICEANPPPSAVDVPDLDGELLLSGEGPQNGQVQREKAGDCGV